MSREARRRGDRPAVPACCPRYHEAVEFIGRRWTGAILAVLLAGGAMRFTDIAQAVPDVSDRLLSERLKELEQRGLVAREVTPGPPLSVAYELTPMGRRLEPVVGELHAWAQDWLTESSSQEPGGQTSVG